MRSGSFPSWNLLVIRDFLSIERSEEIPQLRGRLELWNRLQFLERGRKRVGQAPERSGLELVVLRIEVELVDQRIGEIAAGRDVSPDRATINDLCALVITDYAVRKHP